MGESQCGEDRPSPFLLVETIAKAALPVAVVVYLVGFATTSLYLTRFGVPANDFVKPQYVGAGIWTLLPLLLACFVIHLYDLDFPAFARLRAVDGDSRGWWWAKALGRVAVSALVAQALMMLTLACVVPLLVHVGPRFSAVSTSEIFWIFVVSTIVLGGMVAFGSWAADSLHRHAAEATPEGRTRHRAGAVVGSTLTVLLLLFHVGLFAAYVFPRVPATLGGGKPTIVRFILKGEAGTSDATTRPEPAEATAEAQTYLAPERPGGRLSPAHALFATMSDDYVIYNRARDGAIFFPRALVDGYVVEREEQVSPADR